MAFSDNLQFIRAQAGVTQEQLAEQLEVSRQSVSKWESGTSFPEMDTLLRICDLYDVDLDLLLRGNVEESRVSDTARYDAHMNRFSLRLALSISAIIAGISLMLLLSAYDPSDLMQMMSAALFMLIVAVSTVVIVASGIQHENFRKQHPVIADFYTQEEKDAFHQRFVWYIAGGVGAILFGVVLLIGVFAFLPEKEPYESIAAAVFMLLIAGAVFSFVYGGMQEDKYKVWKYNRDNNPDPEAKKRLDLIGASCGAVLLTATAIYVGLGFTRNAWGTAWWVFAVGGILCGVVSVVLNPYKGED